MRSAFPPAPSYYLASGPSLSGPYAKRDACADIGLMCGVLGGGIAGCSAALHLAKRGYKVASAGSP